MIRRGALLVAILLGAAVPAARAGEPDDPTWARLANADDPGHDEAVEAWKSLALPKRAERVRLAIRSADRNVARLAAAVADPLALDLEELRLAMSLCAGDPEWVANPMGRRFGDVRSNGLGFGTPEIVSIWKTAATTEGFEFAVNGKGEGLVDEFHRATDASLAPDLVPLLETKNDDVRRRLAGDLELVANVTTRDGWRPVFARGFLYLLAREAAVAAKKPVPALAEIEVKADGPGVPEALKLLILDSAAQNVAWTKASQGSKPRRSGWSPWLVRWARDTTPVPADLPFLSEVAKGAAGLGPLRTWAVRSLAALDPKGEASTWKAGAAGDDAAAAAELARQGKPERLRAMADVEGNGGDGARILSWEADPDRARSRYLDALAKDDASTKELDLSPFARADWEVEWGVKVRDADLRAIGRALSEGDTPRRGCAWFYAHAIPEAITPEVARAMAKRLRATTNDLLGGDEIDHVDFTVTLAAIEVRAPEVLLDLLHAWAGGPAGGKRDQALELLARLGDAKFVDAMLATWAKDDGPEGVDATILGRVKDPRVAKFFRARVEAGPPAETRDELAGLAVSLGLPEAYRFTLSADKDETDPEPYATVRTRLLAGDVRAAVLALVDDGRGIDDLWQVKLPEALEALRRIRRDRFVGEQPTYWRATRALAAAGDADARREWLGFLRDGRVRMNDGLDVTIPGALATDSEALQVAIGLLDSNCCLGWQAYAGLSETYPTAPMDNIGPYSLLARNRIAAERWFTQHAGTFVWSRILDGYVPGPSKR